MKKKIIVAVSVVLAIAIAVLAFFSLRSAPLLFSPDAENAEASVNGFKMGKRPKNLTLPTIFYQGYEELEIVRIGLNAFRNEKKLESVIIPEGVKTIDHGAFNGCTALKSLTLPKSLETIFGFAFANCTSIETLVIPNGLITISTGAFSNCTSLKNVYIPVSVSQIENYAFHVLTDNEGYQPIENLVIHCKANSYAHIYAKNNSILFVLE